MNSIAGNIAHSAKVTYEQIRLGKVNSPSTAAITTLNIIVSVAFVVLDVMSFKHDMVWWLNTH